MTQMAAMSFTQHLRTTHLNNSKCSKFPLFNNSQSPYSTLFHRLHSMEADGVAAAMAVAVGAVDVPRLRTTCA